MVSTNALIPMFYFILNRIRFYDVVIVYIRPTDITMCRIIIGSLAGLFQC